MAYRNRVGFGRILLALLIAQLSCGDSSGPGLVASSISANSPTSQSASPGTAVPDPPSVIVRDQNGATLSGVAVTFAVTGGGGSVTGGTIVTNTDGVATVGSWTLGSAGGANTLTASSGALSVTFTANGIDPCGITGTHAIGGTTNGELATSDCKFSDGSFVDFYGTTLTAAGTYVFSQTSGTFDTYLLLYGGNGVAIGINDDFGTESNSRIKAILPSGDYILGANSFYGNITGAYTLTSLLDAGSVTNCEQVFVVRGVVTPQTLEASDCPRTGGFYGDQFFICVAAGQSVTVSMSSAAVDSYIVLYDSNGSFLTGNDNKDVTTTDALLTFTPAVTDF
ncbi:MAG: hypothetical protein M3P12_08910 [Gemmatimonadota bacterium]|nr:hypothetical protein [Gemmatimonadota bacterium]